MRVQHIPLLLACSSFLFAPMARGEEAPPSEHSQLPPPPMAPVNPALTTYVMENSDMGQPKTVMASPVMAGIGAGLGGLGLISLVTGFAVYKSAPECNECPGSEKQNLGIGFMVGGAIGLVFGLPLTIIGARQVPDTPAWARAVPTVFISPRGGALQWTF